MTAKPGRLHPPNDPSHPHDPHDTGETGGLHARTIRPTCFYCSHHTCPLPAHHMRLAVGLSSQFIQPSMGQDKQTFHCVPVRERPRGPCGAGAAQCAPVRWRLRAGRTRRVPPSGCGPAFPYARGRPRVPLSGGGPVFLAPAAAPCPTVRMKLRVPPSGGGPVFHRPDGPRVPPLPRGRHRVPSWGGGPVFTPPGAAPCSPGRRRPCAVAPSARGRPAVSQHTVRGRPRACPPLGGG